MVMKKISGKIGWFIVLSFIVLVAGCGGGGGGSDNGAGGEDTPSLAAGSWSITEADHGDTCGGQENILNYTIKIKVNGNQISVDEVGDDEGPSTGQLSGHTATFDIPEVDDDEGWTGNTHLVVTFSGDWKTLTAEGSWYETNGTDRCDGTFSLSGTKASGTTGGKTTLSGEYYHFYLGFDESDPWGEAKITEVSFDGDQATDHELYSSSGSTEADETFAQESYLEANDTLRLQCSDAEDAETIRGAISSDSTMYATVDLMTDSDEGGMGFDFYMKKSSGRSSDDLSGIYWSFGYTMYSGNTGVGYGTAVFDNSNDTATVRQLFNSVEGYILNPTDHAFEYEVDDDGSFLLSWDVSSGIGYPGIVSPDGNLVVYMDYSFALGSNDLIRLYFLVKQSASLSEASLSGEYTLMTYETDKTGVLNQFTQIDTLTFDGSGIVDGICRYSSVSDKVGDVFSDTYSIDSATGALTINAGGRNLPGCVSPDGSFIVLIVPDAEGGTEVQLVIGMKNR